MITDKNEEALRILQEECAEVIQAISKIFRFGADMSYPTNDSPTNRNKLEEEIGDLLAMVEILVAAKYLDETHLSEASKNKKLKLLKWSSIYEN
jgi:NTP pyrophosphatase (non-canonical NTP hydrolase)